MYLFIIIVSYLYLLFILFSSDSFAFIHSSNKDNKQFEVLKVENYLVSIHEKNIKGIYRHICSGTILSERWVLTAAHCVYDSKINATLKPSVLSISHIRTFNGFLVPVLRIVVHPGFIKRSDCIGSSNLALLQTTMSFDIYKEKDDIDSNKTQHEDIVNDDFAKHYEEDTAIIPDPKLFKFAGPSEVFKGTCYAVSWVLKDDKENGALKLKHREVFIIPSKECNVYIGNICPDAICTVDPEYYNSTPTIKANLTENCEMDTGTILLCGGLQVGIKYLPACNESLPILWTPLYDHTVWLKNITNIKKRIANPTTIELIKNETESKLSTYFYESLIMDQRKKTKKPKTPKTPKPPKGKPKPTEASESSTKSMWYKTKGFFAGVGTFIVVMFVILILCCYFICCGPCIACSPCCAGCYQKCVGGCLHCCLKCLPQSFQERAEERQEEAARIQEERQHQGQETNEEQ